MNKGNSDDVKKSVPPEQETHKKLGTHIGLTQQPEKNGGSMRMTVTIEESALRLDPTPFGVILHINECIAMDQPGAPALPRRVISVALPWLTELVKVAVKPLRTIMLSDEPVLVAPIQYPRPALKEGETSLREQLQGDSQGHIKPSTLRTPEKPMVQPSSAPFIMQPNVELYEREIRQPRPIARLIATKAIGLVQVAQIEISPLRLDEQGRLQFHPVIEVNLSYRNRIDDQARQLAAGEMPLPSKDNAIYSQAQARRLVDLAQLVVINPESVPDYSHFYPPRVPIPPIFIADYLIITEGGLKAAFQPLADWKASRGLITRIVTITEIVRGDYGDFEAGSRDLQEVIRNFLKWAYRVWGIAWVLLGGDVSIIPVRMVTGDGTGVGSIQRQDQDPPPDSTSYWADTGMQQFLKMNAKLPDVLWPALSFDSPLVRPDTGMLIPYDADGTSGPTKRGWYCTTDDSYMVRSHTFTPFVRVNGPDAEVNVAELQWLFQSNMIPTDLYYASLVGPQYDVPGHHDWDQNDNGLYGQHKRNAAFAHENTDLDGVSYHTDIGVGRASVNCPEQVTHFVNKVIAYEKFRTLSGDPLDQDWPRRLLLAQTDFGDRAWFSPTSATSPTNDTYHHTSGDAYSLIKLGNDIPLHVQWQLFARVTDVDVRLLPYRRDASSNGRGWYWAISDTNLTPSERIFAGVFFVPIPTEWVVVYGTPEELEPSFYIFDQTTQDESLQDTEQFRHILEGSFPKVFRTVERLYEDEVDLDPAELAEAPISYITQNRMRDALNKGPHLVSLEGHGIASGWGSLASGCCLTSDMADDLTNNSYTFICYAVSCSTNQFDWKDALSDHLLNNPKGGAVGYVGYSRMCWRGGVGGKFARAFYQSFYTTRNLGLLHDTRCTLINDTSDPYDRWSAFALNLLGDPEMPVWGTPLPRLIVRAPLAIRKRFIYPEEHRLDIRVMQQVEGRILPVENEVVYIRQGSHVQLARTDMAGEARLNLTNLKAGNLEITVSQRGAIPTQVSITVRDPSWTIWWIVLAVMLGLKGLLALRKLFRQLH